MVAKARPPSTAPKCAKSVARKRAQKTYSGLVGSNTLYKDGIPYSLLSTGEKRAVVLTTITEFLITCYLLSNCNA